VNRYGKRQNSFWEAIACHKKTEEKSIDMYISIVCCVICGRNDENALHSMQLIHVSVVSEEVGHVGISIYDVFCVIDYLVNF